jgi:hypothetical protein
MNLLMVEMQRALHRRAARPILLASSGVCGRGVIVSPLGGKTVAELQLNESTHPPSCLVVESGKWRRR